MSKTWFFWGRILYSVPLFFTGLIYVLQPQGTVETLVSFIPGGLSLIYFGGVLWMLLAFAVAINFKPRYANWGIIGLLLSYIIVIHVPALTTGEHFHIVYFELFRNLSLMGGAFMLMAVQQEPAAQHSAQEIGEPSLY